MDARCNRLNKEVRKYSKDLFVERDGFGVIHLYRKAPKFSFFEYEGSSYANTYTEKQYILSFTKDWKASNQPVDWGIEPFMRRISEIDSWRDDTGYDEFCKRRELAEKYRKESFKHELRDRAMDMRQDFAKATNDIVTRSGSHTQTIF
jgi:hypothetical protein